MKVEFCRDPSAQETRVLVLARERTPEVEAIMQRLRAPATFAAYDGERGEVLLRAEEIIRVYTEKRRVLLDSRRGTFALRTRLYEMEARLDAQEFVRISNSEIVRRDCILHLDFSLTGTIRLSLQGGAETYVSRRYVSRIRRIFES